MFYHLWMNGMLARSIWQWYPNLSTSRALIFAIVVHVVAIATQQRLLLLFRLFANAFKSFPNACECAFQSRTVNMRSFGFSTKMSLLVKQFRMKWIFECSLWFHICSAPTTLRSITHTPTFSALVLAFKPKLATYNHESSFRLLSAFVFRLWIFINCNLWTVIIACYIVLSLN